MHVFYVNFDAQRPSGALERSILCSLSSRITFLGFFGPFGLPFEPQGSPYKTCLVTGSFIRAPLCPH